MRNLCIAIAIAALVFSVRAYADSASPNLNNLGKPIELDAGSSPRMYVVFNHNTHKTVKCRTCHHMGLPGSRYASCVSKDCHSLPGVANRDPMSIYMAYHAPGTDTSCYGCHRRLAGEYPRFKGCQPCHMTPQGRKLAAEMKAAASAN